MSKRLVKAYYRCGIVHLDHRNFRDKIIKDNQLHIEKLVDLGTQSIRNTKIPPDYHIELSQFYFHWRDASRMARCIYKIYKHLVDMRIKGLDTN